MWVYQTAKHDNPIVLYDYTEGRSGKYARDYLKDFEGTLHTDGWGGYHRLKPQITLAGCWAHARRKFNDALAVLKDPDKNCPKSVGLSYISKLFKLEKDKLAKKILKIRQTQSKAIVDELLPWAKGIQQTCKLENLD